MRRRSRLLSPIGRRGAGREPDGPRPFIVRAGRGDGVDLRRVKADQDRMRWRISGLNANILANLVGRGWAAALAILTVPLYLRYLGVEAYGLVGAFAVLQAVCNVLDMGLGATLTRELARLRSEPDHAGRARTLVRSLEVPYWAVAAGLALLSVAAGPVATRWFQPQALTPDTIRRATTLMGLTASVQLPFTLYQGGLLGLERQVVLNAVIVVMATLRAVGTVLVLRFVSPTIEAFFLCQIAASALQTAVGLVVLWTSLPKSSGRTRFDGAVLRANLRFAAGMAAITVASLVLTQADKVVLSKLLPLSEFGCYGVAATVGGAVGVLSMPVFSAVFPRLSQLVAKGDAEGEARAYHGTSQVLSVLVFPPAVALAWFSRDVLLGWTRNPLVTEQAHLPTTLLVAGWTINAALTVPFAAMLAHGWTRLPLAMNVVAIPVLIPLLVWASLEFGPKGAAAVWVALNAAQILVGVRILHSRVLPAEMARWYLKDIGLPLAGALAGALAADAVLPRFDGRALMLTRVVAVAAVAAVGACCLAGEVRRSLVGKLRRVRGV